MNLMMPLHLEGAKTKGVDLIPTDDFFKPVFVLAAPITARMAELLGCAFLFKPNGTPQPFEGSINLTTEIIDAEITLAGITARMVLKADKVVKFSVSIVEQEQLVMRCRCHLPEDEEKLIELLRFLCKLNKEQFSVTIKGAQVTLHEVIDEQKKAEAAGKGPALVPGKGKGKAKEMAPAGGLYDGKGVDESGNYPMEKATRQTLKAGKLEVVLMSLEVGPDRYVHGWTGNHKKRETGGYMPDDAAVWVETHREAYAAAAEGATAWVSSLEASGMKEIEDKSKMLLLLENYTQTISAEGTGTGAVSGHIQ